MAGCNKECSWCPYASNKELVEILVRHGNDARYVSGTLVKGGKTYEIFMIGLTRYDSKVECRVSGSTAHIGELTVMNSWIEI